MANQKRRQAAAVQNKRRQLIEYLCLSSLVVTFECVHLIWQVKPLHQIVEARLTAKWIKQWLNL
jgi:hypothetical protein